MTEIIVPSTLRYTSQRGELVDGKLKQTIHSRFIDMDIELP